LQSLAFCSGCFVSLALCLCYATSCRLLRGLLITSGLLGRSTSRLLGLRCCLLAPAIIFAGVAKLRVVVSIATYRIDQCVGGFIDQRCASTTLGALVLIRTVRVPSA
jgi:hypothetical protein